MSVQGYNVDSESSDPVVCVELQADNTALLAIDEGYSETSIRLSYDELGALIADMEMIYKDMQWNMCQFLFASDGPRKAHLLRRAGSERSMHDDLAREPALCGRVAPDYDWSLLPVIGNPPNGESCCKRCVALYQKSMQEQGLQPLMNEEQVIEASAQHWEDRRAIERDLPVMGM